MSETKGKNPDLKRVFIIGCPRSGTTWTGWLFAQHPSVAVSQHSGFFQTALVPLKAWCEKPFGRVLASRSDDSAAGSGYAKTEFRDLVKPDEFYDIARPLATYFFDKLASGKPGSTAAVNQTAEYIMMSQNLLKLLPDAYFIHVVRDPRSVFCSLRNRKYLLGFPRTPARGARLWVASVQKGRELAKLTNRYLEVRYETLLSEGPKELNRIFSWLNLKSDLSLCEKAIEVCQIEELRKHGGSSPDFYRKGKSDSWREELSQGGVKVIEHIARDLMEQFGYECLTPRSNTVPSQIRWQDAIFGLLPRLYKRVRKVSAVRDMSIAMSRLDRANTKSEQRQVIDY